MMQAVLSVPRHLAGSFDYPVQETLRGFAGRPMLSGCHQIADYPHVLIE